MIVGGYVLHLYCDSGRTDLDHKHVPGHKHGEGAVPVEVTAETGPQARAAARRIGWKLDLDTGRASCPVCSGKRKVPR